MKARCATEVTQATPHTVLLQPKDLENRKKTGERLEYVRRWPFHPSYIKLGDRGLNVIAIKTKRLVTRNGHHPVDTKILEILETPYGPDGH